MLLGMLQYQKAGVGLQLLREEILGPERFDFAFRTYIKRWAFKSPQPADFFRCMEDAAGADLAWFWRGWFVEAAALDQAVEEVKQAAGRRPARITFGNRDRMVMPLKYQVTFADDSTATYELPVEVWFHSDRVQQSVGVAKEVKRVEIDPDRVFPDSERANNVWEAKAGAGK
jgi:aminopeptidase N